MKRGRLLAVGAALAALAAALPATAQNPAQAAPRRPPAIPASGRVTPDPAVEARMRAQVKAPEGFELTLFAGPPVAMYPTCLTEAPDGAIYVCVDPNLSLSVIKGAGRVARLVDDDGDGRADRYTTFAEMDSPRGVVHDGRTLYVMHPPNLTAYRDTDGDGISDWSQVLVTGVGFDLDFRGADHTTNGIAMGIDGWIYIAVGDYGFRKAVAADGTQITNRGGAVVRVRPDGTNLEVYATGTRNTYDLAVDPLLNVYARDNTNDGDGWNTRLHYIPAGANLGYPSLYANFPGEAFPSLFDYGGGSGVGALWVQDPGWPEPYRNTLLTADWTVNKVFQHPLTPKGASFEVQQTEFLSLTRPADLIMDARSNLYVASLSGGQFNYGSDTVGYVFRVTPPGGTRAAPPAVRTLNEAQLVEALTSENAVRRGHAQHEILRRGASDALVRGLERVMLADGQPAYARVAAIFTLKQLQGARANPAIARVAGASDARVRALAMRALADRKDQLQGVDPQLFVRALADPDDHVKVQAMNGLVRLGATRAVEAIVPLLGSPDQALSHLAVNALVQLEGRDAALRALDSGSPAVRAGALRVLARMHDAATVSALLERLGSARDATSRQALLGALARLHHREGDWLGDWWTTRPSFLGPYFDPAAWEESPRIRTALREALLSASGPEGDTLVALMVRNRTLPQGSAPLLALLASPRDADRAAVVDALIGRSALDGSQMPLLTRLDAKSPAHHAAVVELITRETRFPPATLPILRSAALDATLAPELRTRALDALMAVPGQAGTEAAVAVLSRINPSGGPEDAPTDAPWRRFVGNQRRNQEVPYFIELARTGSSSERALAYSVLLQRIRGQRVAPEMRTTVTPVIDAAWTDPTRAPDLVRAINIMRIQADYADRLRAYNEQRPQ